MYQSMLEKLDAFITGSEFECSLFSFSPTGKQLFIFDFYFNYFVFIYE